MNIAFSTPLTNGWVRMKKALFQPFDIGKWFTVGFTAFLAGLLDGPGSGGSGNSSNRFKDKDLDWEKFAEFPNMILEWINEHAFWFSLILVGVLIIIVLIVVFTWLSSRGKFMFLDNVIHDKAEVVNPWNEYRQQGNSLFLWRFVYGLISFILIMASLIFSAYTLVDLFIDPSSISTRILSIMGLGLQFLILVIILSYISLFLNDFVVPIMYKNRISTTQAWYKFLPLMSKYFGHFIVYGLFIFVLIILVVISVILFGIFTCCLGFLLLIIPYIGSVLLLPVSYTFRAFSVEFLEQFGDEFHIFPKEESTKELVAE